ncbi:MAG: leucine-rich repeat domain-containing protein [Bacteroidales bacterium]|nr:leucine-rich repeat domain-containing protein [Bacteroidales bacterium]
MATVGAAQAQNLTVKVNGTTKTGQTSLQAALTASDVELGNITSIEISAGTFVAADWSYLQSQASELSKLNNFTISSSVTSVDDMSTTANTKPYWGAAIEKVSIAKLKVVGTGAFYNCASLTSVVLPDATTISQFAFRGCTSLSSVRLPEVITIRASAFLNCTSLSTAHLPKVTEIGSKAFSGCNALRLIYLTAPPTIGSQAFADCPSPRYIGLQAAELLAPYKADANWDAASSTWHGWSLPSVRVKINGATEQEAISLKAAITASGVEQANITSMEMVGGAFLPDDWNYLAAERLTLNQLKEFTITDEADFVFDSPDAKNNGYFGKSIEKVSIAKIEKIGENTFDQAGTLTSVNLPETNTIGSYAFFGCKALASVNLPKVVIINEAAFFRCTALSRMELPSADTIGSYAFGGCTALTNVSLPAAISIGEYAFNNCQSLSSVNLPNARCIGSYAFNYCESLTSISLPQADSIAAAAFYRCAALTHVSLPVVKSIGAKGPAPSHPTFYEAPLRLLQLGAEPPKNVEILLFKSIPQPRGLLLVDAEGKPLMGDALAAAQDKYRADKGWEHVTGGESTANTWYGWTLATPRIITLEAQNGQIAIEQGTPIGENQYTMVPELTPTVSFTLSPSSGYVAGTVVVFETGNEANKVEVAQSSGTYSFAMPAHDVTIRVQFRKRTYEVRATANPYSAGTVSPSNESYTMGSTVRLEATANEGYRFVRWTKGGTEVSTANPYTFECTGEAELVAVFEKVEDATGLLGIHREGLSVYPNPTTGELWLTVPEPVEGTATEVLGYSANGQLVLRVPVHGASAGSAPAVASRIRIDLSGHPAGVYVIRVGHAVAKVVRL